MSSVLPTANLFHPLPDARRDEAITTLLSAAGLRIERIVSTGQATPPGTWFDQDWPEWVILLAGSATLLFEEEAEPRQLHPGDFVHIPAYVRHRVEATNATEPTIWLAVHHRATDD